MKVPELNRLVNDSNDGIKIYDDEMIQQGRRIVIPVFNKEVITIRNFNCTQ